jgi:hypothetical protein
MSRLLFLTAVILACGMFCMGTALADTWTLLIYLDADNNLYTYGLMDVNEMEEVVSNPNVKIIVLFDGNGYGDTVIYDVQHDTDTGHITSPTVDDGGAVIPPDGECHMDDWHTLQSFVNWAIAEYPADHFLLDLWDHGSGIFKGKPREYGIIKGACWDDHGIGSYVKLWEVGDVLDAAAQTLGYEFAICSWDVCLLGQIETAYQLKDACQINIASEDTVPGEGFVYTSFHVVTDDPNATPADLATAIVNDYMDYYGGGVTLSAVDMVYMDTTLIDSFNNLCDLLRANAYYYENQILAARSGADYWNGPDDRDLHQFVQAIADNTSLPSDLRDAANDFLTKYDTFLIAGGIHNPLDEGDGLTIFFPLDYSVNPNHSDYENNINFVNTRWDEFLEMIEDPYPLDPVMLLYQNYAIDDSVGGDGDGVAEPGETMDLAVTIKNLGTDTATNVNGTLSVSSPDVVINDNTASFGDIASGGSAQGTFNITISPTCLMPSYVNFDLALTADGGYSTEDTFLFVVGSGFADDMESGGDRWTHSGTGDQWHLETYRCVSPTHSWKCGGNGSSSYGSNEHCSLVSVPFVIPTDAPQVDFQIWYSVEAGYDWVKVLIGDDNNGWTTLATYDGDSGGWLAKNFDLSSMAGDIAQLKFEFYSDSSVVFEGVYVDDVTVGGLSNDVQILTFRATPGDNSLKLYWETTDDGSVSGYNLYRRMVDSMQHEKLAGFTKQELINTKSTNKISAQTNDFLKVNDSLIVGSSPYTYTDNGLTNGVEYEYLLQAVELNKEKNVASTSGTAGEGTTPQSFSLAQNYPNPFSLATNISFALPEDCSVRLSIYDISGRLVTDLVHDNLKAGNYTLSWAGTDSSGSEVSSGVYVCRLSAGSYQAAVKLVLTR